MSAWTYNLPRNDARAAADLAEWLALRGMLSEAALRAIYRSQTTEAAVEALAFELQRRRLAAEVFDLTLTAATTPEHPSAW